MKNKDIYCTNVHLLFIFTPPLIYNNDIFACYVIVCYLSYWYAISILISAKRLNKQFGFTTPSQSTNVGIVLRKHSTLNQRINSDFAQYLWQKYALG